MGRAPCCDKVGLKKGPWTPEEDQILITFIQRHGHSNWRALPKQAGLLRCGKSCRLRWINYLRPDIKRGNFTKEEEDTIIQLHEMMGNRWSAIAARLPGRTDNEIKNVWHTHLKKKLKQYQTTKSQGKAARKSCDKNKVITTDSSSATNFSETSDGNTIDHVSNSPQQSYTTSDDFSSATEVSSIEIPNEASAMEDSQIFDDSTQQLIDSVYFPIIDDTFWDSQNFPSEGVEMSPVFSDIFNNNQLQLESYFMEDQNTSNTSNNLPTTNVSDNYGDSVDFWLDVFVSAGGAPELPEF